MSWSPCYHKTMKDHSPGKWEDGSTRWVCSHCKTHFKWSKNSSYHGNIECLNCGTANIETVHCGECKKPKEEA